MSDSVLNRLTDVFSQAFADAGFPAELGAVRESDRPDLAPFQCNGAMAAAGVLKKQGEKANPRDIASKIVEAVSGHSAIAGLEIAGPGFININPNEELVAARANDLIADPRTGATLVKPLKVVMDYGGANVAKPMHVGHLRSAVIGEALKRLFRFRGHEVIGDVHLGDWGLQMGHLISELEDEQPGLVYFDSDVTDGYPSESPVTMEDMARMYPAASSKAKEDETRMKRSQAATAELQAGRPGYRALLDHFISVSIEYLKQGYGDLGVTFDLWKGEASVDPLIPDMIEEMEAKGITEDSDGALIIRVDEGYDSEKRKGLPPVMLKSSAGAVLYHTTDLATLVDRKKEIDPDLILYIVDQRQATHFKQVFKAAEMAGWYNLEQMEHLGFGTVNGQDGKPFKTRDGDALRLSDLTQMMRDAAAKRLDESGIGLDYDESERRDIANKVGMAALKFADLQNQRLTNYIFDIERFTAFEGKTGPYMLYAAARMKSLQRNAAEKHVAAGDIQISHQSELQLVLALDAFDKAVQKTEVSRAPHILCEHLFRVAQAYSRFWSDCPVLKDEVPIDVKSSRLALSNLTLKQLELGLDIIGLEVPERM